MLVTSKTKWFLNSLEAVNIEDGQLHLLRLLPYGDIPVYPVERKVENINGQRIPVVRWKREAQHIRKQKARGCLKGFLNIASEDAHEDTVLEFVRTWGPLEFIHNADYAPTTEYFRLAKVFHGVLNLCRLLREGHSDPQPFIKFAVAQWGEEDSQVSLIKSGISYPPMAQSYREHVVQRTLNDLLVAINCRLGVQFHRKGLASVYLSRVSGLGPVYGALVHELLSWITQGVYVCSYAKCGKLYPYEEGNKQQEGRNSFCQPDHQAAHRREMKTMCERKRRTKTSKQEAPLSYSEEGAS